MRPCPDRSSGEGPECRTLDKQVQSPEDWDWLDAGGEEAMSVLGLLLGGEGTGGHASHWAQGRDQGPVP